MRGYKGYFTGLLDAPDYRDESGVIRMNLEEFLGRLFSLWSSPYQGEFVLESLGGPVEYRND